MHRGFKSGTLDTTKYSIVIEFESNRYEHASDSDYVSSGKDEDASDTDSSVEDARVADRLAESFRMSQASIIKKEEAAE